jgi:hypothetical protein
MGARFVSGFNRPLAFANRERSLLRTVALAGN